MLHLAQVSFFKPIIDQLVTSGYSINSIFRSSDLSNYNLDNISNYVPMVSLCSFFETIERHLGLKNLLEQFGDLMTLDKIPDFGQLIVHSPDLLTTCRKAALNDDVVFTNEKSVFRITGDYTSYISLFEKILLELLENILIYQSGAFELPPAGLKVFVYRAGNL